MTQVPSIVADAVLVKSEPVEQLSTTVIKGYDFNEGNDLEKVLQSYKNIGFQASSFGLAVEEINKMLKWTLKDEPIKQEDDEELKIEENREKVKCKIFLGYTSNMISCGIRETIRYLAQHKCIQTIVTTAGGIEEDFIKCLAPTFLGSFDYKGEFLRKKGLNRTGNLIVPNDNYCKFEDWFVPILDQMLEEQINEKTIWTPSKIIRRLGKEINNEESVYYWCYKNDIPVFCPALTDGSLGDMIYFHSYKSDQAGKPRLIVDIAEDIREMNNQAVFAHHTGMVILGGGVIKHHICNANLMRNGADYSVFVNTGQEFDGSDSGAKPDEAISWGKIKMGATPVKICGDASLVFPLLVSQTFVKHVEENIIK